MALDVFLHSQLEEFLTYFFHTVVVFEFALWREQHHISERDAPIQFKSFSQLSISEN